VTKVLLLLPSEASLDKMHFLLEEPQLSIMQCWSLFTGTKHATQFPCPRGYYNPEPMTHSLDSCLPCPPGHYCEKERLSAVSGKCKAG